MRLRTAPAIKTEGLVDKERLREALVLIREALPRGITRRALAESLGIKAGEVEVWGSGAHFHDELHYMLLILLGRVGCPWWPSWLPPGGGSFRTSHLWP